MTHPNQLLFTDRISTEFAGAEIVGTAGVFYKNPDIRSDLALETAENFRDAGLPFVVVDSTPPQDGKETSWIADALSERGAVVLPAAVGGIATQRLQGVDYAIKNGAEKVVGQEPEKTLMPSFAGKIATELDTHDVLIIGRTDTAEASLPPVQRFTERLAGWILGQTHDLPHDPLSGGRGFSIAGAEVLADYPAQADGMNNWIYLYDTPLTARERGLSVGGLRVPLMHPETMVNDETGNPVFDRKRADQFKLQLDYLLRREDVKLEAMELAAFVLGTLDDVAETTATSSFLERIAEIEDYAEARGYVPASEFRVG